jgi:hypothetical protein
VCETRYITVRKGCGLSLLRNKLAERTFKGELGRKEEHGRKWKRKSGEAKTDGEA